MSTAKAIHLLIGIMGVMVLFGLTWVLAALTISEASLVFQIPFAAFNPSKDSSYSSSSVCSVKMHGIFGDKCSLVAITSPAHPPTPFTQKLHPL